MSCHEPATTDSRSLSRGGHCVDQPIASRASLVPAKHAPTDLVRDVTPATEPQSRVLARMHSGPIAEASPPDRPILTALRL